MAEVQEVVKFQSENSVDIVGVLESIEITQTRNDGTILETKDGIPFKTARVRVRVAEGETHQIDMMAMKYFKSKPDEETGQWKAFNTYEKEFVSIRESEDKNSEKFGQTPTVVSVGAQFELNVFKNKAGALQETTRLRGRFMGREYEKTEEEYGAAFTVDAAVLADPIPEVVREEETGRLQLKLGLVDYQNKMQPFTFIAEDVVDEEGNVVEDVTGYLEENLERGQTMLFSGKVINRYLVKQVERPGEGFGKKIVDTVRDRVNEIKVEGGQAPRVADDYDEETDRDKVLFPDQWKEAEDNWKKHVADIESTSTKPAAKKAPAAKQGFGKPATARKTTVESSDLPF